MVCEMNKSLIILYLLPLLAYCSNQQKIVIANQLTKLNDTIEFRVEKEIKFANTTTFEFINNSKKPITIFGPWLKNIEKFESGNWRKVRILNCPCGANCIAPPKILILQSLEKHIVNWNLLESWCDKNQKNEMPLTIVKQSSTGLYRISTDYSIDGIERMRLTKEFNIIN